MKDVHKVTNLTLDNGIKVTHVYIPNFPVALSSFWVKAGSRTDPKGKEGMAHFFEHLLTTRTKKFPIRQERLIEIEKQGFFFNAHTSLETANYHFIHSPKDINKAIDLLIDGQTSSIFEEKDIKEEKKIIFDEERRNRNDPKSYIWRLANSGLWPDSQMGSNFFGNNESLGNISRDDILNFYKKYYQAQDSIYLLINSIKDIGDQAKKINEIKVTKVEPKVIVDKLGKKENIVFDNRGLDYSQVASSFITTKGSNEEDQTALDLIRVYLASGWMSRLITRLRIQEKLTYWVNSHSERFEDTGFIRFTASLDKGKMNKFLDIFEEEIILLKEKKLKKNILDQHKNKYLNDMLRLTLNIDHLNWWYGADLVSFGKQSPAIQDRIPKMMAVTPEKIIEVANKYLIRNNFSIAIIGAEQEIKDIPNFV